MAKVNVIGDSLVDISFGLPRQYIHRYQQTAKIELPFGDKLSTDGYELSPGGSGANVATGLAKAGFLPWFHTGIASDAFGTYLREFFSRQALELHADTHEKQTPLSVILRVGGERTIITGRASGSCFPTAVPKRGWIHVGPLHGSVDAFAAMLVSQQIETGQSISLNPSIDSLEQRERGFMTLLRTTAVMVVNLHEALVLTRLPSRTHPQELLKTIRRLGPEIVCITDGDKGAHVGSAVGEFSAPALADRQERLDATGAGDAFTTGFLAGYLTGHADELEDEELIKQALAYAIANSAAAVGAVGAHRGLLSLAGMKRDAGRVKVKKIL